MDSFHYQTWDSAPILKALFHEAKRLVYMPNRHKPININESTYYIAHVTPYSSNNLESTMIDWVIMSSRLGCRSSEWCEIHSSKSLPINGSTSMNIDNLATTFIGSDFVLRDKCKLLFKYSYILDPSSIAFCDTWSRYQKKKKNGEIVTHERNNLKPAQCYTRKFLGILAQYDCLVINSDTFIAVAMVGTKKKNMYTI